MDGAGLVGFLFLFAVTGLPLVLWALALLDAVSTHQAVWERSGQSQIVAVLVILLAPLVGALIYFFVIRKRLQSVA